MTNYKQLCAELTDELEGWIACGYEIDIDRAHALIDRARAALDEPEPEGPTDEDLLNLDQLRDRWNAQADVFNTWDELGIDEIVWWAQRQALARWGNHPGSPDLKPTVPINMTLKSLSEHNREKNFQWQWQSVVSSQPNGIACPECGQELLDTNPSQMILTAPPQYRVHCPSCGYTGSRY